MDVMYVDAKYSGNVILSEDALKYFKQFKNVTIFASVQFVGSLDKIISQLEEQGIKVIGSKPARANEKHQLLGCDVFSENLNLKQEVDAYLYIGDGAFHPSALVIAQKDSSTLKPVIKYNPVQEKMTVLELSDYKRIFKRYKANLMKFLNAKNIGVLISTKPGQQQLKKSLELKTLLKDKNVYLFAANDFDYKEFENFRFIDVWVNSACPRIGLEDAAELEVSMINLNDAFDAKEVLSKKGLLNI